MTDQRLRKLFYYTETSCCKLICCFYWYCLKLLPYYNHQRWKHITFSGRHVTCLPLLSSICSSFVAFPTSACQTRGRGSSACACFSHGDTGLFFPAQVTCPASQSPPVKINQSSPHSWEAVGWEGEPSSRLQDGIQPFLLCRCCITRLAKDFFKFKLLTRPQLKSAISTSTTFFMKALAEHCSLPSALKPPFGNFGLMKPELPLCTSEGAFSPCYPAFRKRISLFWVTWFYRMLCRNSSAKTCVAVNL